jgi:hypothetical protein
MLLELRAAFLKWLWRIWRIKVLYIDPVMAVARTRNCGEFQVEGVAGAFDLPSPC